MGKTLASGLVVLAFLCSPLPARGDSFVLSTTVSTAGQFFCVAYAECLGGGSSITIPSTSGTATVTFTGVTTTFDVTNSLTTITLGRFEVTATEGYSFPVNRANPELSIFRFTLHAANPTDLSHQARLLWTFGPGGGSTLAQRGTWNFGVPLDSDPAPYSGINFRTSSPVLAVGGSTLLTAEAGLIPEPSTMLLLGTGLVCAAVRRRRMSRRAGESG